MYQKWVTRLFTRVTEKQDKNPLPWNLVELGGVVAIVGAILAWYERNPEAMISAGALIAIVGGVIVLVGLIEVLRRR